MAKTSAANLDHLRLTHFLLPRLEGSRNVQM